MGKPKSAEKKIFVLDTSVILYNHNALNSFEDNDVAIPITVLEELDNFKKGNDTINFEAREFIRIMDKLSDKSTLTNWIPLNHPKAGKFKVVMNEQSELDAVKVFWREQARSPHPERGAHHDRREPFKKGHPGHQGHQPSVEGKITQHPGRRL